MKDRFADGLGFAASERDDPKTFGALDDFIDVQFIARRTRCIANLVYYPFMVIALMIVARSSVFDNFSVRAPILAVQGGALAIMIACGLLLNRAAEHARKRALENLSDKISQEWGRESSPSRTQWEKLRERIVAMREGAFRPFLEQPLVGAALFPVTSFGWTTLLERGILGL